MRRRGPAGSGEPRRRVVGRPDSAAAAVLLRLFCTLAVFARAASTEPVTSAQELRQAFQRGDTHIQIGTPLLELTGNWGRESVFPAVTNASLDVSCALPQGRPCVLQLQGQTAARFFTVGSGGVLSVYGVTMRGGGAVKGGALFVGESGFATLRDCAFENNSKTFRGQQTLQGGAVHVDGGSAFIEDALFYGNGKPGRRSGNGQIGGAIYVKGGSAPIPGQVQNLVCSRCNFTDNVAQTGGALVMTKNARVLINSTSFSGNTAVSGGAIWGGDDEVGQASSLIEGGNLRVDRSEFNGNYAVQNGGGAAFDGLTTWVLTTCIFKANRCGVSASAWDGVFDVAGNTTRGGAVDAFGRGGTTYGLVQDCVFQNNSAHSGGAMAVAAVQQGHLYWQKSTYEANSAVQGGALWLQDILKIALLNECTMLQGSAMQYGGSMYANNSLFRARFSQFTTSTAAQGGAIWCGGQSDITLDSCQVFENGAFQSGGGLHVEGHAVLTAVQSEFDSNYVRPEAGGAVDSRNAAQQGGAVAIFTSGRGNSGVGDPPASSFRDCNFTNNFAKQGGAMLVSARADLFRCHFSKNYASVGGSLKVAMATNLLATNCTFRRGIAEIRGGGVAVESSKAEFKECFFLDNRAADLLPGTDGGGGGMHVSGSVAPLSVKLQQCVFSGNRAQYGGGALFGRDSSVRIDSSQFLANVAEAMGGAVRLGALPSSQGREGGAHAEFSYVDFIGHAADKGAGAMDIRQSKAKLDNCNFVDNMARGTQGGQDQWGGAVRILDRQSEVDFNACTFTNNTATYGGAVYAGIGAGILLSSCEFRSNSARSGGAVRVESSAEVMVNACKFVKQLAAEGGAISALGPPSRLIGATTAWVRSSEFSDNEAESSGGAIFAVGSDIFLKSNIFLHNRVKGLNGQGGGAFSLTSVEFSGEVVPGQMTFEDDQFSGHQAHTGGTGTVVGSSTVSFVQTTIRNSSALGDGGALFGSGEDVQLNFIHGVLEQAWAGALGGCVALENGGSLFAQGTKFRHCTAGFASRPVSSERGRGTGNTWQPFSDERADNFLRSRQSRQEISMGGGVSLTGNSTAFFDKQVELSDNFAYGWGGGIGASKSQVFARQTIFERNIATDGGGALHASQSWVALLSGPQFRVNMASMGGPGVNPPPRRHRRLLAPALREASPASDKGGGALHFGEGTRAVCEQCEFSSNEAPLGGDVFLGPEVEHSDIYISSTAFGSIVDVYPSSAAAELMQGCWPLSCGVDANLHTTTCGEQAVHTAQLTRGTSSLGFAESVVITNQEPYFLEPRPQQCVQSCLNSAQILFPPTKCTALVPSPPVPLPSVPRTDEFPVDTPEPSLSPPPTSGPPLDPGGGDVESVTSNDGYEESPKTVAIVASIVSGVALLVVLSLVICCLRGGVKKDGKNQGKKRSLFDMFADLLAINSLTRNGDTMAKETPSSMNSPSSVGSRDQPTSRDAILVKSHLPKIGGKGSNGVAIQLQTGVAVEVVPSMGGSPDRTRGTTTGRHGSEMSASGSGSIASQGSAGFGHIGPRPESLPNFPEELEIDWNVLLGSGGYGQVFLGTWSPTPPGGHERSPGGAPVTPFRPRRCAVKVMTPSRNAKERGDKIRSFQEEAGMMGRFRGVKQVVDMIAADVEGPTCWIVYELLPHGTLASRIHDHTRPRLSLMTTLQYCIDIAKGLEALHAVGVVHRDLKLDNLLMDEEQHPKLIDFGISRARDPNKTSITTECVGTWAYMAPEQFSNRVSEKVDVYAFGVCIWEIWTRQRPWQDLINDSPWQLVIAIMNDDERLPIPPSLPSPLRKLVEDCWKADPRARPNMSEIVTRLEKMAAKIRRGRRTRSASCDAIPIYDDPVLAATIERIASTTSEEPAPSQQDTPRGFGSIVYNPQGLPSRDRTEALADLHSRQTQSAKELGHMVPGASAESTPVGPSRFAARSETNAQAASQPEYKLSSPYASPEKRAERTVEVS